MNDLQKKCLEIFKYFKEICDDNNLTYFAIGGTCIGAIRHEGFIPWDDDIDIAMPYADIIKLFDIMQKNPSLYYEVISPYTVKHFKSPFFKIHDNRTTFIETHQVKYPDTYKGVDIDIMPIFGTPNDPNSQYKMERKNSNYIRLNGLQRSGYERGEPVKRRIAWALLQPLNLINNNIWFEKMINRYSQIPFDNSDKILFGWRFMPKDENGKGYKSLFDYCDFSDYIEKKFEDTFIRVPIGYHNYLSRDFGNYMELPPKEKQIPVHDAAVIDLEKSYKEYEIILQGGITK